jgi:hypothetical protein
MHTFQRNIAYSPLSRQYKLQSERTSQNKLRCPFYVTHSTGCLVDDGRSRKVDTLTNTPGFKRFLNVKLLAFIKRTLTRKF